MAAYLLVGPDGLGVTGTSKWSERVPEDNSGTQQTHSPLQLTRKESGLLQHNHFRNINTFLMLVLDKNITFPLKCPFDYFTNSYCVVQFDWLVSQETCSKKPSH